MRPHADCPSSGRVSDNTVTAPEPPASQLALEAAVRDAFAAVIARRVPVAQRAVDALIPDAGFRTRGSRLLWTLLTRDDITQPGRRWDAYLAHLARCDRIAGDPSRPVSAGEAEQSRAATEALARHVRDVSSGAR